MEPKRMLTAEEVAGLPERIRAWYEANDGLRDREDLPLMPERVRAAFERLTARSRDGVLSRIAQDRKAS